jgi:hypothetical protein
MGRLAVTRLSDGRLELWAMYGSTLVSAWQSSLNPALPWTPFAPFTPSPLSGTEIGVSVYAGHSPDGRVQLWVNGGDPAKMSNFVVTTWTITGQANSGWFPWEPFPTKVKDDYDFISIAAVGQLKDGRMQLFGVGAGTGADLDQLWTNWKSDTEINSKWSGWQLFTPGPVAVTEFVAAASRSNGLLQIWTGGGSRPNPDEVMTGPVQSTWQTSSSPSVAWNAWQSPFLPQLSAVALTQHGAAGQLADSSDQIWTITSDGMLHSTWWTSPSPTWANWISPFLPDPGVVDEVAVGRLHDDAAQLFVATRPAANGIVQIFTSRQTKNNPNSNPPGWTPWELMGTVQA